MQTPQWFFDLPDAQAVDTILARFGKPGRLAGRAFKKLFGDVPVGDDPYVNDPKMFYDVIQRRRNWANASFCCGAGSVHRREATMSTALKNFGSDVSRETDRRSEKLTKLTGEAQANEDLVSHIAQQTLLEHEFTPYKFHVSEDILSLIHI